MSKINQFSATEKLAILQELETGRIPIMEIAKKSRVGVLTMALWKDSGEHSSARSITYINTTPLKL